MGKPWTPAEDKYVRQRYGKVAVQEIATALGRTIPAVRNRAQAIGAAPRHPSYTRLVANSASRRRFPAGVRDWLLSGGGVARVGKIYYTRRSSRPE
ncbi:MAG: hypothetical protein HQP61_02285 [Peptococcaceae bacterium]|nr:hypothetical protein [Candidatus Syntrophopropionicum ammoniitolerans]